METWKHVAIPEFCKFPKMFKTYTIKSFSQNCGSPRVPQKSQEIPTSLWNAYILFLIIGLTRNLFAEKILEKLPHPCPYSIHGCLHTLLKDDPTNHLTICQFRETHCPLYSCLMKISVVNLMSHIAQDHPDIQVVPYSDEKLYHRSTLIVSEESFESSLWCNPTHLRCKVGHNLTLLFVWDSETR